MKLYFYLTVYFLLLHRCFYSIETEHSSVDILIEQIAADSVVELVFDNIISINDFDDPSYQHIFNTPASIVLSYKKNVWFLNNKKLKIKKLQLKVAHNAHDCIVYKNNKYPDTILIIPDECSILIINRLCLEEYVKAVIAKEVFPEWNNEALKTIAIVARTYAVHLRDKARQKNKMYHLKSSIHHQKYEGKHFHESIENAVSETHNMIIVDSRKKPILAMYHVCCGGVIPWYCVGFDFKNHPYLKRKNKCVGCNEYKNFCWNKEISYSTILNNLKIISDEKNIIKLNKIISISYAKTGAVRSMVLEVEIYKSKKNIIKKKIILNNKKLRTLFDIKLSQHSAFFDVSCDKDFNFIITGKGQGHHIGLCQRGMYGYTKQGKTYKDIILFYYPGTEIINFIDKETLR
jgi:stage II sporulation protein D